MRIEEKLFVLNFEKIRLCLYIYIYIYIYTRRWSCHGIQQYQLKWEWFLTWIHGWGRWA